MGKTNLDDEKGKQWKVMEERSFPGMIKSEIE